jgi:undecaprenyl-phosphate 4-deoxy-4-formamido-L-arabinose transferase
MEMLSFVIPCYNSPPQLKSVVSEISSYVDAERYEHEIILVNDGSPAASTWELICQIARDNTHVTAINLSKNFGQPNAILAGFGKVSGDYVICLDDDGQTPPSEFPKILEHLKLHKFDVVYGSYAHKQHSLSRNMGSKINQRMGEWLIGRPKGLSITSYYCLRRFVADEITKYDNAFPYISGLIFRVTKNISSVVVEHKARDTGNSGYTVSKLFSLWCNGFTNFSVRPLRIASFVGLIMSTVAFLFAAFVVAYKIISPDVAVGWASMIAAVCFFSGVQLLFLGACGEYIGRMFMCINKQPQYVIKEEIHCNNFSNLPTS